MFTTAYDILKATIVLFTLIMGVLVLPFFLAGLLIFIAGWIIYMIIKAVRLHNEQEKANAKAKEAEQTRANAGY